MLNRVVMIGRLTAAPEIRYTTSGTAKSTFTIAVDRYFQSAKSEKTTDFFPIITWGKLAERCKEWLVKGQMVGIDGKLQMRVWETPQGDRRKFVEIRADDVRFLSRPAGYERGPAEKAEEPKPKPEPPDELDDELEHDDEDPFKEDF